MVKRSMMSQLASVSEGALGKLASSEMRTRAFQGALQLKERVEKMVGAITELDERLTALEEQVSVLEERVAVLEKPKRRTPARRSSASKTSSKSASSSRKTTS